MKTRVALFGVGRIGQIHLRNLITNTDYDVAYLCDINLELATSVRDLYNLNSQCVGENEFATVFNDKTVNAVIIGTTTDSHEELCVKALESGKHVMCEKPLAKTLKSVVNIINLAKKTNLTLMTAFNRRFCPQIRKVWEHVQKGDIGEVRTVKTVSRDHPRPPISYLATSGGIFHDCAIHDFDMIRFHSGQEPEAVFTIAHAFYDDIREIGDVDAAFINFMFPNGAMGHVEVNRFASFGHDVRIEVLGSNGQVVSNNQRSSEAELWNEKGTQLDTLLPTFRERYQAAYAAELVHFHELITGSTSQPLIRPCDPLRTTILADAARQSWLRGEKVIIKDLIAESISAQNIPESDFWNAWSE